jgi:hypothetical protein
LEVGEDNHGIQSSEGGVENMEFGKDVGGIDNSRGDVVGIKIHGGIDGSQLIAKIINIFTSHVVEDVNAIQRRLASVVFVATSKASHVISESIQTSLDIDDLMFNDTCGTPSSMVGEIAQKSFIDIWEQGCQNGRPWIKNTVPDIHFVYHSASIVRTASSIRFYAADAVLPVDGFLSVRASGKTSCVQMGPTFTRMHSRIRMEAGLVLADRRLDGTDAGPVNVDVGHVRADAGIFILFYSHPPPPLPCRCWSRPRRCEKNK